MYRTFYEAHAFNQPLESWDVSNVENMETMFCQADVFNQPLDKWNVAKVTNMKDMFADAKAFNQPLNSWKTSIPVQELRRMFKRSACEHTYGLDFIARHRTYE